MRTLAVRVLTGTLVTCLGAGGAWAENPNLNGPRDHFENDFFLGNGTLETATELCAIPGAPFSTCRSTWYGASANTLHTIDDIDVFALVPNLPDWTLADGVKSVEGKLRMHLWTAIDLRVRIWGPPVGFSLPGAPSIVRHDIAVAADPDSTVLEFDLGDIGEEIFQSLIDEPPNPQLQDGNACNDPNDPRWYVMVEVDPALGVAGYQGNVTPWYSYLLESTWQQLDDFQVNLLGIEGASPEFTDNRPGYIDVTTEVDVPVMTFGDLPGITATPIKISPATRAIISVHGSGLNSHTAVDDIRRAVELELAKGDVVAVSPIFAEYWDIDGLNGRKHPLAGCNYDDPYGVPLSVTDLLTWDGDYAAGDDSDGIVSGVSTFDVLDQLVEYFTNSVRFPNLTDIVFVGHSGGGQAVPRYAGATKVPDEWPGYSFRFIGMNAGTNLYLGPERWNETEGQWQNLLTTPQIGQLHELYLTPSTVLFPGGVPAGTPDQLYTMADCDGSGEIGGFDPVADDYDLYRYCNPAAVPIVSTDIDFDQDTLLICNASYPPSGCNSVLEEAICLNRYNDWKLGLATVGDVGYLSAQPEIGPNPSAAARSALADRYAYERDVRILVGGDDFQWNIPGFPRANVARQDVSQVCERRVQGVHRLHRWDLYREHMAEFYGSPWVFLEIPGVDHDQRAMYISVLGRQQLFGP